MTLPGSPDIILRESRVAIQINGCFWHAHANCPHAGAPRRNHDWWQAKFERTRNRDMHTRLQLEEMGWTVLTLWECELREHPDQTHRLIRETLVERPYTLAVQITPNLRAATEVLIAALQISPPPTLDPDDLTACLDLLMRLVTPVRRSL